MDSHDNLLTKFGAKGDGETDDTVAFQKAVDALAEKGGGTLCVPDGHYLISHLKMKPFVGLYAHPTWGYRGNSHGATLIEACDPNVNCLIDITGAIGSTIDGLVLLGNRIGKGMHGILNDKSDIGEQEDTQRIERTKVHGFTGCGVKLEKVWCFTIRHNMLSHNVEDGLCQNGWDGFVLDNWLSGNGRAGYGGWECNASVTMTGNRIEWNGAGGIVLRYAYDYNITGNFIDRSFGPAIDIRPQIRDGERNPCHDMTITGNIFRRSGKTAKERLSNTHVYLEGASGIVMVGNQMAAGQDDLGKGRFTPDSCIIYKSLTDCIIKDNVMGKGAMKELNIDLGEHGENLLFKDNIGSILQTTTN
ncbi:right-handed parallel beta-helix repeat-containing protein [Rubellicoccus peritrichatus]|uniref:Right-handed parallel beta-helix repeat-containing protein n=1 Tax=Rubellicoccus peritrichatus TaxID=3080537 RepID=A0AAQ3LET0_9BACT|nr:right-handed parallel beta-helix repeat-containing protein [Puniceicoccus sp. CR14]WOO43254.1 right-handed parallel beta-helix repeat-containing protein [Puniceicoccus sp. CR14]